jgi:hypothetical protein
VAPPKKWRVGLYVQDDKAERCFEQHPEVRNTCESSTMDEVRGIDRMLTVVANFHCSTIGTLSQIRQPIKRRLECHFAFFPSHLSRSSILYCSRRPSFSTLVSLHGPRVSGTYFRAHTHYPCNLRVLRSTTCTSRMAYLSQCELFVVIQYAWLWFKI